MVDVTSPVQEEVYRAIDLGLRVGEVVLSSGAGAADVTASILAITSACGLRGCVVDVTFTSITVSYQASPDVAPETYMRTVRARSQDYSRLTEVDHLVRDLTTGRIDRVEARSRLDAISSAGRPYPRWSAGVAKAAMACGVALLLGGGWRVTVAAFLMAGLVDYTGYHMSRRRVPAFYQQVTGAAIATGVALVLYVIDSPAKPSLVVATGIVLLLAGISLVGAIQDALSGYYVTAAARSFEAILLTGGIIAGVSVVLEIALRVGLDLNIRPPRVRLSDLPVVLAGGTMAAVAFAFASYAPRRSLLPIALVGLSSQVVYQLTLQAHFGIAWASAAAALVVGVVSYSLAGRVQVPPLVVVVSGIVTLLPGLTIYRGLFRLLARGNAIGLYQLATAVTIGVALASGVLLGEHLAQPLKREARRLENRLAGPRLVGPIRPPSRRRATRMRRQ